MFCRWRLISCIDNPSQRHTDKTYIHSNIFPNGLDVVPLMFPVEAIGAEGHLTASIMEQLKLLFKGASQLFTAALSA